jgi:hypothetical protein
LTSIDTGSISSASPIIEPNLQKTAITKLPKDADVSSPGLFLMPRGREWSLGHPGKQSNDEFSGIIIIFSPL